MRIADLIAPRGLLPMRPLARQARVAHVLPTGQHMRRIVLQGPDLAGVQSPYFDDHIKFVVPGAETRRNYTIRAHDSRAQSLSIDFVLHEDGPATAWAAAAKPGMAVSFFGPKPRGAVRPVADTLVMFGDATAIPAIARCLEQADAFARRIVAYVHLPDALDRPADLFAARAQDTVALIGAGASDHGLAAFGAVMREFDWSDRGVSAWIATETTVARALRRHLLEEEAFVPERIRAAGYWRAGVAAGSEKL